MKPPDRVDAARQALGQVLAHPATWAPFLPVAAAYAFIGVPWWLCLPLMVACMVVVLVAWSRYWPRLMDQARTELLTAYRAAENAELGERVGRLAQAERRPQTAHLLEGLRKAMGIKQAVESRLFADGIITAHQEEVGAMVSELVCTMVQEAERLALDDASEVSPAAEKRFDAAADTLRRAYAEIDVILDPVPEGLRLPVENDALARASERLNEKLAQARGVRRHLERGLIVHEAETVPEASASGGPAENEPTAEGS
jgi:hypothetical protein